MFCTSLRRRPSFARIVPQLTSTNGLSLSGESPEPTQCYNLTLNLEDQLSTHDICLSFPATQGRHDRKLRLLLLSPEDTLEAAQQQTLARIQHFSSSTGGVDIAIIFSMQATPPAASTKSCSSTTASTYSSQGIPAYASLQAQLLHLTEASSIPVLPLATLDGLSALLKTYTAGLSRPLPKAAPLTRSLDLLPYCSACGPLPQFAVNLTTDLFTSLQDLATTALRADVKRSRNTEAMQGQMWDSEEQEQLLTEEGGADERMAMLRDQLGQETLDGMIDFWADEWVAD